MAAPTPASTQDIYPSRPVTLVIPFPPGGLADTVARAIAPQVEKALGKPLVLANKPGAGGAIGAAAVAHAAPDGYTLLFTLSSLSTLPEQAVVTQKKPSFELSQLAPLARVSTDPMAVIVRSDSPLRGLPDLLSAARARAGQVSYGSSGNYGTVHVPVEMLAHAAGVSFNHIPYTGGGPLMTALLGGQIDFTMLPRSSIMQQVRAGKLRVLATVGSERWPQNPEFASTASAGLVVDVLPWTGAFAPADTPMPVVERLRAAFRSAAQDLAFRDTLIKADGVPAYLDAPEFRRFWEQDAALLGAAVKRMGKLE